MVYYTEGNMASLPRTILRRWKLRFKTVKGWAPAELN